MLLVVCDTSPVNYLVLIRHDHVLPKLFDRVLAPPAVLAELRHKGAPANVRQWSDPAPSWLEVRAPAALISGLSLGRGESEAISLARELAASVVLIDERRATDAAERLGLFVTGTLGVLEAAAAKRLIQLPDAIAALRQTSFRCTERLYQEALERQSRLPRPRNS